MSILGSMLAEGGAGAVKIALDSLGSFAKDIREAITGKSILDPNKQAELLAKAQENEQAIVLAAMQYDKAVADGQVAINIEEAKSPSLFKGGWRPFIGWTCGAGLGIQFIVAPVLVFAFNCYSSACLPGTPKLEFPSLNVELLVTLVFGMLGLGGMRTFEKLRGKA